MSETAIYILNSSTSSIYHIARDGASHALCGHSIDPDADRRRWPGVWGKVKRCERCARVRMKDLGLDSLLRDIAKVKGGPNTTPSDAALLDWLASLPAYDDYTRWKLRRSTTGRGWRLMTTSEPPNYTTPREALIAAFEECRQELDALDHVVGEGDGGA